MAASIFRSLVVSMTEKDTESPTVDQSLSPEIRLLIRDEVEKNVERRTGDDRLFIRQQLHRISAAAKYIGIAIVAVITIFGIKTAGDLHAVAVTAVKDAIEKKGSGRDISQND
jgi:hypothetical protein